MFASIRRHQKWLWLVIVTLTIISFVWYFNPNQRGGGGGRAGRGGTDVIGSVYGKSVTIEQYQEARREAALRFRITSGTWPDEGASSRQLYNEDNEIHGRLLLDGMMNKFGVRVTDSAVAEWISTNFRGRDQGFHLEDYEQFIQMLNRQRGVTEKDFRRLVEHEVAREHLVAVFGVGGKFVTPQEAEALFRQESEQVDSEVAFFAATNYLALVPTDPAALEKFYTNQTSRYRIAPRVQVSYVRFEATNHFPAVDAKLAANTNLSRYLDQQYAQRGTNFYPDLPPDAAKAKIKDEIRLHEALVGAQAKANEFVEAILEMNPKAAANLDKLAAASGLPVKVTLPFTQYEGPSEFNAPESFAQIAFGLSEAEPYGEQVIVGDDAVFAIAFKAKLPSEVQPLETVRERVTEDFRRFESQRLTRQAGEAFHAAVAAGMAQGKSFPAAAADAKTTLLDLPPFSQRTTSLPELGATGDLTPVKAAAFGLALTNSVTAYTPTREGGFVLHVQARVPVEEAKVKADLPQFTATLRQSRQMQAFSEWYRKEIELAKVDLPGRKDKKDDN